MICLKNKTVYLYEEPLCKNLDINKIKDYIEEKLNIDVKIRRDFISYHLPKDKIEYFAKKLAEIRVRKITEIPSSPPSYGEIEYEKRLLVTPKRCSILYDGFMLQLLLRKIIPLEEYQDIHIIFTNRLLGTFDEIEKRYHARVIICGHPSIISTVGIAEALAKPREFYYMKQTAMALGIPIAILKEKFRDKIIEYDDRRLTEFMKGYVMQALMYAITGEPFCNNRDCRLFNAHYQEELINAQLNGEEFCEKHKRIIDELRGKNGNSGKN